MNVNDNHYPPARAPYPAPDPHGQAALLLVESLIHGLIAREILTVADAVEIIEVAAVVKEEIGLEMGDTPATMTQSLDLLQAIRQSIARDV